MDICCHVCTHGCLCIHIYRERHECINACMIVYIHINTQAYLHMHVFMHVLRCVGMYTCMHACALVSMHAGR